MMVNKNLIIGVLSFVVVSLLGTTLYFALRPVQGKHGFIVNQIVFDGFKGKHKLEKSLKAMQQTHTQILDSLELVIKHSSDKILIDEYNAVRQRFSLEEEKMSVQYTEDIWKEINLQVAAFGRDSGYDFIYGAIGNGSLMYGSESYNVTEQVVQYLNEKYEGER